GCLRFSGSAAGGGGFLPLKFQHRAAAGAVEGPGLDHGAADVPEVVLRPAAGSVRTVPAAVTGPSKG
ncbi:hypothetical protein SB717_33925, partial [Priestia sp. SIMBA_032]|uniref:hypothetical protein n=1 Tax=Priestia sp. SIMBA_032 TaxID=3085775 RepID=UPI00397906AC